MANQEDLRRVVCTTAEADAVARLHAGAWLPRRLPQRLAAGDLIQAQRDYFGAHTYERVDAKGTFHTEWGRGEAG